jgi:hypothetical protein
VAGFVPLFMAAVFGLIVYDDARKRDWSSDRFANRPWKWAVGAAFFGLLVIPIYVIRRRNHPVIA